MENVIVLERTLEEVSIKLGKTRDEENCSPERGSRMVAIQKKKKRSSSRVKFYRQEPYPIANGLLIGF